MRWFLLCWQGGSTTYLHGYVNLANDDNDVLFRERTVSNGDVELAIFTVSQKPFDADAGRPNFLKGFGCQCQPSSPVSDESSLL